MATQYYAPYVGMDERGSFAGAGGGLGGGNQGSGPLIRGSGVCTRARILSPRTPPSAGMSPLPAHDRLSHSVPWGRFADAQFFTRWATPST